VNAKTVAHYIDILVDLLLVRRLEPWHVNVKKRLVKSPRLYVRDSGILHRLLGIEDLDGLLSNPVLGKSWEGFVIENILSALPNRSEAYFYRTAAGAEIDLLLKLPGNELWAIEVKSGMAPKVTKGFHLASSDVGATHKFVVYGGMDEFPAPHETTVLSTRKMLEKF
jgi:predicted AAA+ superfamily ATPase